MRIHFPRLVELGRAIVLRHEAGLFMNLYEFGAEVFGIICKTRLGARDGIERLPEMFYKFAPIKVPWDRIKWVEIVEFEAEFVRDAVLCEDFRDEAMNSNAAHRANVDAPGERLLVANTKYLPISRRMRIPYLARYSIGPEHRRIVSRR